MPTCVFVVLLVRRGVRLRHGRLAMMRTKEIAPTDVELAQMRSQSKGIPGHGPGGRRGREGDADRHAQDRPGLPVPVVRDVHLLAVRQRQRRRVGLATQPRTPGYEEAAGWVGLMNGTYNFVTMISALFLLPFCHRSAARRCTPAPWCWPASRWLVLSTISSQILTLVPDDRPRHLLGEHGRGPVPDGREHGAPGDAPASTWGSST